MTINNRDVRRGGTRPGWFFSIRQRLGDPNLKAMLVFLLAIDLVFLVCHILNTYDVAFLDPVWNLGVERSYSEWFQYFKHAGIVVSLGLMAFWARSSLHTAFAVFFGWVLLDDSLALHEQIGDRFVLALGTSENVGEVIALAGMGLIFVVPILYAYLKVSNLEEKAFSLDIVKLLVVFAVFGGVLDFIDSEIYFSTRFFRYLFGTLEDFGENVAISFILTIAFGALALYNRDRQQTLRKSLHRSE
ncbi:MAG: hypothetical protein AAGM36_09455 [Cyanobacteria bacterium J06597_1]